MEKPGINPLVSRLIRTHDYFLDGLDSRLLRVMHSPPFDGLNFPFNILGDCPLSLSLSRQDDTLLVCVLGIRTNPDLWELEILRPEAQVAEKKDLDEMTGLIQDLIKKNTGQTHQILAPIPEKEFAFESLIRAGFNEICGFLDYNCPKLENTIDTGPKSGIEFKPLNAFSFITLKKVFLSTCENTLDCPEGSKFRDNSKTFATLVSNEDFCEDFSFCLIKDNEILGFLIGIYKNGLPEIQYLGVLPKARGRKYGYRMVVEFLERVKSQNFSSAQVLVDERNWPARGIYESLGFESQKKWKLFLA